MNKPIYLFSTSSHPNAVNVNSLDVKLLKPQIDFSKYDYLIVTSKQVSKALTQYEKEDYLNKKALCVSTQSAISFKALGGRVLEVGSGYGDNLTAKIKKRPKKTKWLYLRAKIVASNFVSLCKEEGYDLDEAIVYETSCSKEIKNVETVNDAVLIFTSPSSVHCFLKNHNIDKTSKVVVIGLSTASALPNNVDFVVANETTIESCMDIAHNLLN